MWRRWTSGTKSTSTASTSPPFETRPCANTSVNPLWVWNPTSVLSGSFYFFSSQVDTFDINICTAKTQRHVIDFQVFKNLNIVFEDLQSKPFQTAHETDLHRIEIPLEFHMLSSGRGQLFNSIGGWLILNDWILPPSKSESLFGIKFILLYISGHNHV